MNKVKKDGKVAVLYSPGFGAGWSTWASEHAEAMCMDARIVQAFVDSGSAGAIAAALQLFPDIYTGGAKDLRIEWIKEGTQFEVEEYDGSESIHLIGEREYMVA